MVDRLVVQSQDTINALSIDPADSYSNDIESAKALIKDADNSKTVSNYFSHNIQLTKLFHINTI